MGRKCVLLFTDIFHTIMELKWCKSFSTITHPPPQINRIPSFSYITFRCIDDVLSLNNLNFNKCLYIIYPNEPKIKNTDETRRFVSFFLDIDKKKTYSEVFSFPIVIVRVLSFLIVCRLHVSIDLLRIFLFTYHVFICYLHLSLHNQLTRFVHRYYCSLN